MLAKGVLVFCTSYAQNNSSWYLGKILSSPSVPGNGSKHQGQSQGNCNKFLPVSPRRMPVMSEWPMQGLEEPTWKSSPHRTQVIVPRLASMPPRGMWGSGERSSSREVESCILEQQACDLKKNEPNSPAIGQSVGPMPTSSKIPRAATLFGHASREP